ncbi:glycosyltransferase [Paludibaculum fermentans]|uniref:glycosyltransferase n=1 Tax=Paludibaculum fermentans TaxID=1473598 RepID=UPI003EBA62CB
MTKETYPTRRDQITLAVACPMANEGDNASKFVTAVLEQCTGFRSATFFAVLDRATTDNTRQILDTLAASEPRLKVVWAPENRCVVDAYVRGYRDSLKSGADWVLEIDAGFSHQPTDIPRFFETMAQGYDCVFGSRFMPGGRMTDGSFKRYVVSRGGTILSNLMLGTRLSDMTSGFELFSSRTLEQVLQRGIQSRAHFFQTEIKTYCRNLRITEVPIHYQAPSPRLGSSALKDSFRQLWRLFRLRLKGQL